MLMATRSSRRDAVLTWFSGLSNNDTRGAVAGLSAKTSAKRPNPTIEVQAGLSSSLTRPLKRTLVGTSISKAPHKKRAGNQNENMMTLPIEIFTQVLSYVTPCSLVALIRTNKALRRILLDPSSKPIWQSAAARVPGLPVCPIWMSEPRYAVLLFSESCTLCGASTALKPDPHLFARLCASCRDTGLVDDETVMQWNIENLQLSSRRRFCLRQDVEQILQQRAEPNSNSSSESILMFNRESGRLLLPYFSWLYDGHHLAQYLSDLEQARRQELEEIKNQRRELIHERLFGLGWTVEDFRVHETYVEDWNALVEVARPLSDPTCKNLISKLSRCLEGSRKAKERDTRYERVEYLLTHYGATARPFNSILAQFCAPAHFPPHSIFPTIAHLDYWFTTADFFQSTMPNPLPDINTLLGWDLIQNLYEDDIPVDIVNERFKERIPELEHRLAAWRAKTEERLIDNLDLEHIPGPEVQVEASTGVCGKTDTTMELPASTRFLLRADTIFKLPTAQCPGYPYAKFGNTSSAPQYYPYLFLPPPSLRDPTIIPRHPIDLSMFKRYDEAEKIAKALLADYNRPDVAYIELKQMGARFNCLRCHQRMPWTWGRIVEHYGEMNEKWENQTKHRPEQTTKHKIVFVNAHELRPGEGPGRERLMRSGDVANTDEGNGRMMECKLCLIGWPSTTYACMAAITQHLRNVHEVTGELLENLHYGEFTQPCNRARYKTEWCTRWDSYHSEPRGQR
ncbi:hypothetical protein FRC09_020038 [Ceratobasidium sp. 395]|nr:hypothetical protein FRC09_020038 [Ceratobasidium sp. 395]